MGEKTATDIFNCFLIGISYPAIPLGNYFNKIVQLMINRVQTNKLFHDLGKGETKLFSFRHLK